jgi:chromosome segregation ATPase
MTSIIQQTATSFNDLSKELDAITNHLETWAAQQSEQLDSYIINQEASIEQCHQKIEELTKQHGVLVLKRKEMEERLRADYLKEEQLTQKIRTFQSHETQLPEKLNQMKEQIHRIEQEIAREKQVHHDLQQRRAAQSNHRSELPLFERTFGLQFKFENGNWLRCSFVAIDRKAPNTVYSFCVRVYLNTYESKYLIILY